MNVITCGHSGPTRTYSVAAIADPGVLMLLEAFGVIWQRLPSPTHARQSVCRKRPTRSRLQHDAVWLAYRRWLSAPLI